MLPAETPPLARPTRRAVLAAALGLLAVPSLARGQTANDQSAEAWAAIRGDLFGERPIEEGTDAIRLDAPARAADPAIVPVDLAFDPARRIRTVTLVIDRNPAPVAATFVLGAGAGLTRLSTRVRVDAYTDIHAVAEDAEGRLHLARRFVKAAGGCAAPAAKDPVEAAKRMGEMRLREFASAAGSREAQVQIRHPNSSGLQKDQVTLLYIPAHFVSELVVARGGETLFSMSGGISISEDPSFRFTYAGGGGGAFHVTATDTEGQVFEKTFPASGA